ncbi:MAG: thermonuclease family protein [Elusimicrobiota bacterium]
MRQWIKIILVCVFCVNILHAKQARVTHVIDGDTIIVDGLEHIRLLGVNTPEVQNPYRNAEYFGAQASSFTKRMLNNKNVVLEYDAADKASGYKDKYGRTLAYVYIAPDDLSWWFKWKYKYKKISKKNLCANEELLKNGFAYAMKYFDYKEKPLYLKLDEDARNKKLGFWKKKRK